MTTTRDRLPEVVELLEQLVSDGATAITVLRAQQEQDSLWMKVYGAPLSAMDDLQAEYSEIKRLAVNGNEQTCHIIFDECAPSWNETFLYADSEWNGTEETPVTIDEGVQKFHDRVNVEETTRV